MGRERLDGTCPCFGLGIIHLIVYLISCFDCSRHPSKYFEYELHDALHQHDESPYFRIGCPRTATSFIVLTTSYSGTRGMRIFDWDVVGRCCGQILVGQVVLRILFLAL